jgi:hypothetical protein
MLGYARRAPFGCASTRRRSAPVPCGADAG